MPSILRKLEEGTVDFETAFSKIIRGPPTPSLSTSLSLSHPSVSLERNLQGQVQLTSLERAFPGADPPLRAPPVMLQSLASAPLEDGASSLDDVPGPVVAPARGGAPAAARASPGEVVSLAFPQEGIALVTLCDEENRNMFSAGLVRGVQRVFADIGAREDVKVVVVQGFGNWFCSGGTPEPLQAIRKGEMSFLDDSFFKSRLDCPLPTIAAIQGHALGGGLTLGLYADLIVMAEHAFYAANFMEHGFTPGVGATHLFPLRFGPVLGVEMMLTARRYQGRELKARGAPMEILPREKVLERAMELATSLASKPLLQLKRLKAHLADPIHQVLPAIMEKEQAMHDLVFAEHREDPPKEGSKE